MTNGTLYLWKHDPQGGLVPRWVGRIITLVTRMPYTHVAIYLRGQIYDKTVWREGPRWRSGLRTALTHSELVEAGVEVWEPRFTLSGSQSYAMQRFVEFKYGTRPYNVFKLVALVVIYPLRRLFARLQWVPFSNEIFGEVCSTMPDEAFLFAEVDILPNDHHGYTAPGDFVRSGQFERV